MFTGIVEHVGSIARVELGRDVVRLEIDAGPVSEGVRLGDSVLVHGACLTVTAIDAERLSFEAVRETLDKTAIAALQRGDGIHLERAMRADGRFGGHIVQGHVDGLGRVRGLERDGDDALLFVDCPAEFAELLIDKGSVAIDGVALTVVDVEPEGFHVALIPHTLGHTTLGQRSPGSPLNLEADVLGKYVKRYLDRVR